MVTRGAPYNLVEVVLDLLVLRENTVFVHKLKLRWVESNVTSQEQNVVHPVALAVRPDVWSCPVTNALDVGVLLGGGK